MPAEDELGQAAGRQELLGQQVRRMLDQCEAPSPLPNELVAEGVGDEVREPGGTHHVPVAHEGAHRLGGGQALVGSMAIRLRGRVVHVRGCHVT